MALVISTTYSLRSHTLSLSKRQEISCLDRRILPPPHTSNHLRQKRAQSLYANSFIHDTTRHTKPQSSLLKLPLLPTHRTLLHRLRIKPLHNTVNMKAMRALPPNEWAIISGQLTIRAARLERHSTYAARIIVSDPAPNSHCMPVLYPNFQSAFGARTRRVHLIQRWKPTLSSPSNPRR